MWQYFCPILGSSIFCILSFLFSISIFVVVATLNKTIADKLMYIPNDDTQRYSFCRFKSVVETFEHPKQLISQSKFIKSSHINNIHKNHYVTKKELLRFLNLYRNQVAKFEIDRTILTYLINTTRANRYGRTDGPTIILEKLCFLKRAI